MESSRVEEFYCPRCGGRVAADDRFCRNCAAPLGAAALPQSPPRPLADRAWFVLLMLFVGLGPLALPMLWQSNAFSPAAKIALTGIVLLLTLVLIAVIWYVAWWIAHQLAPLKDLRAI